jgi:hypothetical protein
MGEDISGWGQMMFQGSSMVTLPPELCNLDSMRVYAMLLDIPAQEKYWAMNYSPYSVIETLSFFTFRLHRALKILVIHARDRLVMF